MKHSEIVLVQNNPLYDYDDGDYNDSDQNSVQEKLNEPTLDTNEDESEVVRDQVHLSLSKTIIKPWE